MADADRTWAQTQARIGMPFEHDEQLQHLRRRQQEIAQQLLSTTNPSAAEASAPERMASRLAAATADARSRPPVPSR